MKCGNRTRRDMQMANKVLKPHEKADLYGPVIQRDLEGVLFAMNMFSAFCTLSITPGEM